jgi:murein L,D-transpeptidase YafK
MQIRVLAVLLSCLAAAGLSAAPETGGKPAYLLEMSQDGKDFALLVDKQEQQLYLYHGTESGPRLFKKFRCTTGRNNNGTKLREGDLKTPNGVYFFRGILEDGQLPDKYGVRAFPMDYPNDFDRLRDKTGSGIWLHAVDEDGRVTKSYDTEGCVVVTNDDIMELSGYITLWDTPIIVDDSLDYATSDEYLAERGKVLDFLETWRTTWQGKELDKYMDCYDERFIGYGRTKDQHREHKKRLNQSYKKIAVKLTDIDVYAFHTYLVISFNQEYTSDRFHSVGRKKLYLARDGENYRIISERISRM